MYRGPFSRGDDDDGHTDYRGEQMAVCDKTFRLLQREPYRDFFDAASPREELPLNSAEAFDCRRSVRRNPRKQRAGVSRNNRFNRPVLRTGWVVLLRCRLTTIDATYE